MTRNQREILARLYRAFKKREFSVENSAMVLGLIGSSASFRLIGFAERGILNQRICLGGEGSFSFAISPRDYPQCFADYNTGSVSLGDRTAAAVRVPLAAASA